MNSIHARFLIIRIVSTKNRCRFVFEDRADPNLPTEHEWARPLAQAENQGHTDMKELLERHQ